MPSTPALPRRAVYMLSVVHVFILLAYLFTFLIIISIIIIFLFISITSKLRDGKNVCLQPFNFFILQMCSKQWCTFTVWHSVRFHFHRYDWGSSIFLLKSDDCCVDTNQVSERFRQVGGEAVILGTLLKCRHVQPYSIILTGIPLCLLVIRQPLFEAVTKHNELSF